MKSVRSRSKEKLSKYYKPMLATLGDEPFDSDEWVFEIKLDGYRAIAEVDKKVIRIYSRNGLSFNTLYPLITRELAALDINAVLDGEIVVFNDNNKPDFQKLQQFGDLKNGKLVYYVFDCLYVNGKSIMDKPLVERKEILQKLLPKNDVIRFAEHISSEGKAFFNEVKRMDLEGMIAKLSSSPYKIGKRSTDWLKIKNHSTQEAIIAGYTAPRNSRSYFGALILAIRENNKLKYIGHTGTGFTNRVLKDVYEKMQHLVRRDSPFDKKVPVNSHVTWVDPKLVCNIEFSEVTQGGILRHPVFMGLRVDKSALETNRIELPRPTKALINKSDRKPSSKNTPKKIAQRKI
jgi:bifunctional non-homologous end joining protein LigD